MSSDEEVDDNPLSAPHRPPVRAGKVRICLAGLSRLCVNTGYSAKLIRAIVDNNESNYESWFYFERRKSAYHAFVDSVKHELNEEQRTRYTKRTGWSSPFIWLEYPDGRRDAKGGSEKLRKWAKETFDDKGKGEEINSLTARSPSRLSDLFYDIEPGTASPEGPEGGTFHSRLVMCSGVLMLAALDVHYRGIPMSPQAPLDGTDELADTQIDPIAGVMYKKVDTSWTAEEMKMGLLGLAAGCLLLGILLWYFYSIPLPTAAEAKAAAGMTLEDEEEEKQRRIRKARKMDARLKKMQKEREIKQIIGSDASLIGNARSAQTLLQKETAAFKEQQKAERKKRKEEKAAAAAAREAGVGKDE